MIIPASIRCPLKSPEQVESIDVKHHVRAYDGDHPAMSPSMMRIYEILSANNANQNLCVLEQNHEIPTQELNQQEQEAIMTKRPILQFSQTEPGNASRRNSDRTCKKKRKNRI
ncbi:hypothetical protein CC99x_006450 [Candidatus Berkiella cookevillensis]|nr:hypothetical protein [Candidatus Berkiella cookevillensis]MCS5708547.1 hypothetical protein [Candidatus Berkiella cookevillensis]